MRSPAACCCSAASAPQSARCLPPCAPTLKAALHLPGAQLPDADMNSEAEADVTRCRTIDFVTLGIVPLARIAICRTEKRQHLFALADRCFRDCRLAGGRAEKSLNRRFESHGLFERGACERWICPQLLPLVGKADEAMQRRRQRIDGGVHAGRDDRTNHQRSFLRREHARVCGRVNIRTEAMRRQSAALYLLTQPFQHRLRVCHGLCRKERCADRTS